MKFLDIIDTRAGSILCDFRNQMKLPIMSVSANFPLAALGKSLGGEFTPSDRNDILTFHHPRCADNSFVMVRPDVDRYREVYLDFINTRYGFKFLNSDIPKGFDVDHLLARSNSPSEHWIRLEAVHSSINRSHGGGIEKSNSTSKVTFARKQDRHRPGAMTWLVAAKLAMIKSPVSRNSKSAKSRTKTLVNYFVCQGFNREHVEIGITQCQHELSAWLKGNTALEN